MSCFIFILFRIWFPASEQYRPLSDTEFCGVLIWVCSVSLCHFLWEARCIWVNTAIQFGRSYILLHPRESSGMYFPRESANQIHLSYIYSYVRRNKVSKFAYQIGQFTGIQSTMRPGIAFSCTIPRSQCGQRFTRNLNRIWVKGIDVYKNKNSISKYFDATNAV